MAGAGGVLVGRGYVSVRPEFEGDWNRSVSARASQAGRQGGGAFGKAFGAAVGPGLKMLGALAGVAITANLNAAAASAALLAPALTTAAVAAGALKVGMSGVGDALKAGFEDTGKQASTAAASTRAVEAAQRGLANAQRALADARVQAAERVQDALRSVEDAERRLARTVADAAQRQADAKRKIEDAVRELAESQDEARKVQADLTKARADAAREIEDLTSKLENSRLKEREAMQEMAAAEKALRAAQAKEGNRPEDVAKLQLAYDKAAQAVKDQALETKQLGEDAARADKVGVDGSDKVLKAQERIADAQRRVEDRTRSLARAREEQRRTEVDAARDIAEGQRALADAQRGVDEARRDGARQIADAQRAVADATRAVGEAQESAAAQVSAYDDAMSKLAPNAQAFVRAVQALGPAWDDMKMSVQNRLFEGLDSTVTTLGQATIPVLKRGLTETAGVWNTIAKNAAGAVTEMAKSGMLDKILSGGAANLRAFEKAPAQILTMLGQLSVAAQPAFNKLSQQMAGGLTSFSEGIAKSFESGGLEQAIGTALGIVGQFGTLLGNVLGTVSEIFKAASDAGGEIVGVLGAVFGELRRVLGTEAMQAQLRNLFGSVAQIVSAIVPLIGAVVQSAVPLLAAIAEPVALVATVLGPVLLDVVAALGAALLPVIQSLAPVLTIVGTALVQLVQAVAPLLQPIGDLIASVITALAPALTPIVNVLTGLVAVLIGPLTLIVQALTPALELIGRTITGVFQALEPMLGPLVVLIGQVAELIAGVFTHALGQLLPVLTPLIDAGLLLVAAVFDALQPLLPVVADALETLGGAVLTMLAPFSQIATVVGTVVQALAPLLPIGVQLVTEVLGALVPVLPVLAKAFVGIAGAVLALAVPLAALVGSLAGYLAPIIADLTPLLGDLVGMFVGLLVKALPPLTRALSTLVTAASPVIPLIGRLVGMVLGMGAGVIQQLLPAVLQLAQASVDLTVALLPILPPLVTLVGLVVQLAVKVLGWLLPPLVSLVGFLAGALAGAVVMVVGRLSGLVTKFADLINWIVKVGSAFRNLKDKVITPVMIAITTGIATAWAKIKTNVLFPVRDFFTKTIPGWANTVQTRVVGAWAAVSSGIATAWGKIKSQVLYPARDFFTATVPGWANTLKTKVVNAFDAARAGIKTAWDKIKEITKAPISFVVHTVYNQGIRKVWNLVTDAFGGKRLEAAKFARGGTYGSILPGYTPGRDPHHFVSPTGGRLDMSGGEAIMRPEWTRAVGPAFVNGMNFLARTGGVAAVRRAMAGGEAYKDGGIFGWIDNNLLGGYGSKAWDKVKAGASWLKEVLAASARAGVERVVTPMLSRIPGLDTGWGQAIKRLPVKIIDALFGYTTEADKRLGSGKWMRPVDAPIGTRYGVSGPMWSSGYHTGTDFPAPTGTLVRAVQSGVISAVGSTGPYGNHIRMTHPGHLGSLYAHLSKVAVTAGQSVTRGATIGQVGSTGNSSGPHLHLEALKGGARTNPELLFDGGGWLPPRGLGYNGLSTPEAVFTPGQFKAFEGAANVGLAAAAGGAGQVTYEINARTADFTVADLDRVTRVQNARARVGRPR